VVVTSDRGRELDVRSNVLLFRARGSFSSVLAAERQDTLEEHGRALRLLRRTLLLAHDVLPGPDLPVFV
jgi:3-phenylpropionate/cinnamic acid dioxygenase small subunit